MRSGVSVILPVYNGASFIGEALDSLAAQTQVPDEVVVIDDGSTDASAAIAAEWRMPAAVQLRVVRQANRGVAAARNRGLTEAAGDLIAFIDQDDRWEPRKLELQLAAMAEAPAVLVVTTHQEWFLQPGYPAPDWLKPELLGRPLPGWMPGTVLLKRSALEIVGQFDEAFPTASDVRWFFQAKDGGLPMRMLPQVLVHKRIHAHNQSNRNYSRELIEIIRLSMRRSRSAPHTTPRDPR